ncbi:MAG: hypothetical protein ACSHX9_04120 [Luteolibacter sp.]
MQFNKNQGTLLCLLLLMTVLFAQRSNAALTISLTQSGADTVVNASGALDLTSLSFSDRAETETGDPFLFQQLGGNLPQDLVRLLSASFDLYRFPFGTNIFSNQFGVLVANNSSGQTFGVWSDGINTNLYVPARFTSGSLSGSMVFENVNLSSLGAIAQEIDLGVGDEKKVIITVVPEVSCLAFLGFGGVCFVFCRSRRA